MIRSNTTPEDKRTDGSTVRAYNALALDTATNRCIVAVGRGNMRFGESTLMIEDIEVIASSERDVPRKQMQNLHPMISEVLSESGLGLNDISLLVCGVGPGSFSGVRLGVMTAKTLSQFLNIPLLAVSSLEILAFGALKSLKNSYAEGAGLQGEILEDDTLDRENIEDHGPLELYVLMDGKKGELYVLKCSSGLNTDLHAEDVRRNQTELIPVDILKDRVVDSQRNVFLGDALQVYSKLFEESFPLSKKLGQDLSLPSAEALIEMVSNRNLLMGDLSWSDVLPQYLRRSQAEEDLEKSGPR